MERSNGQPKPGDGSAMHADTTRNNHLDENLVDDAEARSFEHDAVGPSIQRSDTTFGSKLTAELNRLSHISERSELPSPLLSPAAFANEEQHVSNTTADDMDSSDDITSDDNNDGFQLRPDEPAHDLYEDEAANNEEDGASHHQSSHNPARPAYSGSGTPSFQNHTKASLAKLNEKVEIVSRSPSLKLPPSRLSDTRRSSMVFDHRSQKSSPGERVSPKSFNDDFFQQALHESSTLRETMVQVDSNDDEERNHYQDTIERLENELEALWREKRDWVVEREKLLLENQRLEGIARDVNVEREATWNKPAAGEEEVDVATDDDSMPAGLVTNDALKYSPSTNERDQATQTQNEETTESESVHQLESRLADVRQQLDTKANSLAATTQHASQLDTDLTASNDALKKLQQDFKNLSRAARQELQDVAAQISSDTAAADQHTFTYLRNVVMSTPEAASLQSTLIELSTHLATAIPSLRYDIATASLQPSHQQQQQLDMAPWQSDHLTWHARYLSTLSSLQTLHARFTAVQRTAAHATSLGQTTKHLRRELTRTLTSLSRAKSTAQHHRAQALAWAAEAATAAQELATRTTAFEQVVEAQKQEMIGYVRAYWEKVGDERYWEVGGCLEVIGGLEREVDVLRGMLEEGKVREGVLSGYIARLGRENTEYRGEVERLERGIILGGSVEGEVRTRRAMLDFDDGDDDDDADADDEDGAIEHDATLMAGEADRIYGGQKQKQNQGPKQGRRRKLPYIPRCHLPSSIDKREAQLQIYRAEQSQKNMDEEKTLLDILEKARKFRLCQVGIKYPPERRDWKVVLSKSSWERWGGEEWMIEEADEVDVSLVEDMKEKGLLK